LPVVDLTEFPNSVVDVFIELPQTDAGTRCAGICAASMALADAGIPMKGMVAAVSMGRVDDKLVVDLDYSEESYEKGTVADIPIAIVSNTQEISLLQMDGELSRDELKQAIEIVKKACSKIDKIQRNALKERYEVKNG